ncbi:hypothetical protein Hdeb2414_s0010g00335281 [Helianthus debilis subsp. tardiflorus]
MSYVVNDRERKSKIQLTYGPSFGCIIRLHKIEVDRSNQKMAFDMMRCSLH